ncbi:MAG: hypothetical protein V3S01_10510, partial [Dehalococcoidia bacterium]
DKVTIGHASLTVVGMKGRRILQVRLTLSEPAKENPDLRRLLEVGPVPDGGQIGGAGGGSA